MKSKDVKEEEVVRIPIAFAMVKLMQTLPPHIMEANLPGYAALCVHAHWLFYLFLLCTVTLNEHFYFPVY